ncbi:hypothetical protein D3C74_70820 [compost metagenome]
MGCALVDGQDFIFESVKVVRGFESRTVSKKESLGWELVSQTPASMGRVELRFRKKKQRISKKSMIIAGSVLGCLALIIGVGAVLEDSTDDEPAGESLSGTEAPSASVPSLVEQRAEEKAPDRSLSEMKEAETSVRALTVDSDKRVAELMATTQDCGPLVAQFAKDYRGKIIKFDAAVWALNKHDDYHTRYDILVSYGGFTEEGISGPNFQFRDVSPTLDLHFGAEDVPDSIGVGDELTITAEVKEFEEESCLFLLEPVATSFR